jgi:hypothetical protein
MLITRSAIVQGAAGHLARATTVAIRYSAVRRQGFRDAVSFAMFSSLKQEKVLMDVSHLQAK